MILSLNGEMSGGYLEPAMNPRMSAFSGLVTLLAVLHHRYNYNNFLNRGIQYNRGYLKIKKNKTIYLCNKYIGIGRKNR